MTAPTSATWPLHVAIADAINADAALLAALGGPGRVYSLTAPKNARPPFVTLGSTSEGPFRVFGKDGSAVLVSVHLWTPGVTNQQPALELYGHLRRVLDRRALELDGPHALARGELELVDVLADPDGETTHAVARYTALTQQPRSAP